MTNSNTPTPITLVGHEETADSITYLSLGKGYCPVCKKNILFSQGIIINKTTREDKKVWECLRCENRWFNSPPTNRW